VHFAKRILHLHSVLAITICAAWIILYPKLIPIYASFVLSEVTLLLVPRFTRVSVYFEEPVRWGVVIDTFSTGAQVRQPVGGFRYSLGAFLALALEPFLLAFTPVSISHRLKIMSIGILLTNLFHVCLIASAALIIATVCRNGLTGMGCGGLRGALIYANYAAALALWWGLTGKIWIGHFKGISTD
jgi:hypothetical protein